MTGRLFDFNRAIVREPAASVVRGERAGDGEDPSYQGVLAEHAAYVDALEAAGVAVDILPPLEAYPDSMFVEDPALVFSQAAILLRPGAASRSGERATLEPALRERFETLLSVDEGRVDGGDILVAPDRIFIGLSGRTDRTGAEALAKLLDQLGFNPAIVATPPSVLHFKTACSLVDEETILCSGAMAASGLFDSYRVLALDPAEEAAANALRINDTFLLGAGYPRAAAMLAAHGLDVQRLDVGEIAKIDAGLSCMSLRWTAA